jgi:hypothetical protein
MKQPFQQLRHQRQQQQQQQPNSGSDYTRPPIRLFPTIPIRKGRGGRGGVDDLTISSTTDNFSSPEPQEQQLSNNNLGMASSDSSSTLGFGNSIDDDNNIEKSKIRSNHRRRNLSSSIHRPTTALPPPLQHDDVLGMRKRNANEIIGTQRHHDKHSQQDELEGFE